MRIYYHYSLFSNVEQPYLNYLSYCIRQQNRISFQNFIIQTLTQSEIPLS